MKAEISVLKKTDYRTAVGFAEKGMHFDWYLESRAGLSLYSKYFWCKGLTEATDLFGAYVDGKLAGVLMADMGGKKGFASPLQKLYVRFFEFCQHVFFSGFDSYGEANADMLAEFSKTASPDGEIYLLAVSPDMQNEGVGTLLIEELSRRHIGSLVYLFTDSGCNFGYYPHKGFETSGERDIILKVHGRDMDLKCFLFSRKI